MFSPDGEWIAYQSDESGRFEIYVQPYLESGSRVEVSIRGGVEPLWSPDGRELFYRPLDENGLMSATIAEGSRLAFAEPKRLFEGRYARHPFATAHGRNYDVMPDGDHFVMIRPATATERRINVVTNWFDELRRLVPTDP